MSLLRIPKRRSKRWNMAELEAVKRHMTGPTEIQGPQKPAVGRPPHAFPAGTPKDPSRFGGFSVRLPWCPSVNNAYANGKNGGRFKVKRAVLFAQNAAIELAAQQIPKRRLSHPMAVTITQHFSSARGDIDNGIKGVLDALKVYGVIADDNRSIIKRVTIQDGARVALGNEHVEVNIACVAEAS